MARAVFFSTEVVPTFDLVFADVANGCFIQFDIKTQHNPSFPYRKSLGQKTFLTRIPEPAQSTDGAGIGAPKRKARDIQLSVFGINGSLHGRGGVISFDQGDRKSTRLNSSHVRISYAVFCL